MQNNKHICSVVSAKYPDFYVTLKQSSNINFIYELMFLKAYHS